MVDIITSWKLASSMPRMVLAHADEGCAKDRGSLPAVILCFSLCEVI
jgi:hypothetical protein